MRLTTLSVLSASLLIVNPAALFAATPAATAASAPAPATALPPLPSPQQLANVNPAVILTPTLDPQKHQSFVDLAKKGNIDVLFLGDSITDWWREANPATGHNGKQVFDQYFGNLKVANFGIAGEGTQHVLWRLRNGEGTGFSPKVIMLLIGTNDLRTDTDNQIAIGVASVVVELLHDFPTSRILLLGIFPRSMPNDPVRNRISNINHILSTMNDLNRVFYLDIGPRFISRTDGSIPLDIMADGLHPTAKGYQIWAEAVKEPLNNLLKLPPPPVVPAAPAATAAKATGTAK